MFVFTETTHRIWPELREVAVRAATEAAAANITTTGTITPPASPGFFFEIEFPSVGGRNKTGRQMVLRIVRKQPPKVEMMMYMRTVRVRVQIVTMTTTTVAVFVRCVKNFETIIPCINLD